MNCYRALFCPRCYLYDCEKHVAIHFPRNLNEPASQSQEKENMEPQPSNGNAEAAIVCKNPICWKNFQGPSRSPETILMEWSAEDRDFFEQLVLSLGRNYCMMANLFLIKHCRQIHEYVKLVGERDASLTEFITASTQQKQ